MSDQQQQGSSSGAQQGADAQQGSGSSQEQQNQQDQPDVLERVVSWASALLLVAALGYLIWEGLSERRPPTFAAQVDRVWDTEGRYYVELSVVNNGGESVQNLQFALELMRGDSTVVRAPGSLSWVPSHSERRATVILDRDPRAYEVAFVPQHYEFP